MPTEHASVRVVHKPWGVSDLQPWSSIDGTGDAVGELWFERADKNAPIPALLLKLLFTSEPLSIQVHPDDTFARAMGMPNGKSEAWYIISAKPGAQIGVGLEHRVTPQELRASIKDGSIVELVQWRPVAKGDVIFIPAGTIHALGAGIVLAEIQQRSDTTFRLFDYGRQRELHEDNGVAVANTWPLRSPRNPMCLTGERTVLVASRYFVLERLELPEGSSWALLAEAGDLDSRSRGPRRHRIGRGIDRTGDLRWGWPYQHRSRRQRVDGPGRLSGEPLQSVPCCSGSASHRPILFQKAPRLFRNWQASPGRARDAAPKDRGDRQFVASPLRNRDIYDRPATRDLDFTAKSRDLYRGDDRPRSGL